MKRWSVMFEDSSLFDVDALDERDALGVAEDQIDRDWAKLGRGRLYIRAVKAVEIVEVKTEKHG